MLDDGAIGDVLVGGLSGLVGAGGCLVDQGLEDSLLGGC